MEKTEQLKQLEVFKLRNVLDEANLKGKYYALKMGYEGEAELEKWVRQYGSPYWEILTDFWFAYEKTFQADMIIIMPNGVHLSDAKNFNNWFTYKNEECRSNDIYLSSNIMTQMNDRTNQLKHIIPELSSSMVFINENCQIDIDGNFNYDILQRHQLRNHIYELKRNNDYPSNNIEIYKNKLLQYQTQSTFELEILSKEVIDRMIKGINCYKCNNYHVSTNKTSVCCKECGCKELKSHTINRMIKQLSYLYYGQFQKVNRKCIYEFINKQISLRTISRVLSINAQK